MKAYFEGDKDVFVFKPIPKAKRGRPKKDVPDTNVVKTNADHIRSMTDEELADFMCELAYGRKTPWAEPFARKFCDNCPTVHGTYESGQEDDFTECDFVDGKCPHGSDTVWWLKQAYKEDGHGQT